MSEDKRYSARQAAEILGVPVSTFADYLETVSAFHPLERNTMGHYRLSAADIEFMRVVVRLKKADKRTDESVRALLAPSEASQASDTPPDTSGQALGEPVSPGNDQEGPRNSNQVQSHAAPDPEALAAVLVAAVERSVASQTAWVKQVATLSNEVGLLKGRNDELLNQTDRLALERDTARQQVERERQVARSLEIELAQAKTELAMLQARSRGGFLGWLFKRT